MIFWPTCGCLGDLGSERPKSLLSEDVRTWGIRKSVRCVSIIKQKSRRCSGLFQVIRSDDLNPFDKKRRPLIWAIKLRLRVASCTVGSEREYNITSSGFRDTFINPPYLLYSRKKMGLLSVISWGSSKQHQHPILHKLEVGAERWGWGQWRGHAVSLVAHGWLLIGLKDTHKPYLPWSLTQLVSNPASCPCSPVWQTLMERGLQDHSLTDRKFPSPGAPVLRPHKTADGYNPPCMWCNTFTCLFQCIFLFWCVFPLQGILLLQHICLFHLIPMHSPMSMHIPISMMQFSYFSIFLYFHFPIQ